MKDLRAKKPCFYQNFEFVNEHLSKAALYVFCIIIIYLLKDKIK